MKIIYQGKFTKKFTLYSVKNFTAYITHTKITQKLFTDTHTSLSLAAEVSTIYSCLPKKAHFEEHLHHDQHKPWASQSRGQITALPAYEQR